MVSTVMSAGIYGIEGYRLMCECDVSRGLPSFDVVGLPDAAVKESRDRVRAAVKNCGFEFPLGRITINLAPADLKKEGTVYDLPILIGILVSNGQLPSPGDKLCFAGELSLEGWLRPVPGVLPMAIAAREAGMEAIFVPVDNAAEAAEAGGITVYPAMRLTEITDHLSGKAPIAPFSRPEHRSSLLGLPDFSDVMGQEGVKRALEVAAAGGHNILLCGPPGSGKSMLAKRLPSILPDMTRSEMLETTKIYSVAGLLSKNRPIINTRPYRSPHHTVSAPAMAGGGSGRSPHPGEVSLAHNGVLFLDELPEFSPEALEVLRQPLEDGHVTVSRVFGSFTYPSRMMLVCAMNPCRCGWYGHPSGRCKCSDASVARYNARISGPLLDRIDIHIAVPSVEYESLASRRPAEPSSAIRERVNAARTIQLKRYEGSGIVSNSGLTPAMMKEYCALDADGEKLLEGAFRVLGLTARAYDRILKVARTVADLDGSDTIKSVHLAEALQYRPSNPS